MAAVSIYSEQSDATDARFRAVAGSRQTVGHTAGEALDALNAQLGPTERSALVVVQQMRSDCYFSESKYLRMRDLLDRRDHITEVERGELEQLVKEEMLASAKRSEALADALWLRTN